MRLRELAGLTTAAAVTLGIGLPAPAAVAAEGDTLFVNRNISRCSDQGSGTEAVPYCTIQAAADAAKPGQTVRVAPGRYREQVNLTQSGTAQQPISFVGGQFSDGLPTTLPFVGVGADDGFGGQPHGFALTGVHNVRVSGFVIGGTDSSVALADTGQVTFDGNRIGINSSSSATAVRISGASSDTAITRNIVNRSTINGTTQPVITVEAGVRRAVVAGNSVVQGGKGAGVLVTDAPGTVVTGNTVSTTCGPAVALAGSSATAVVENNILAADWDSNARPPVCDTGTRPTKLSVSEAAEVGSVLRYNLATPFKGGSVYQWGGTHYDTVAAFTAASGGQGSHDLVADPLLQGDDLGALSLRPGSPAIDSADADAPGELGTDLYGHHRIDDPYIANTGTRNGVHDRGATEYTTSSDYLGLSTAALRVATGTPIAFTVNDHDRWSPAVSYTVDFGDGASQQGTTAGESFRHTYATPGTYRIRATAALANGDSVSGTAQDLTVSAPGPLVPVLSVTASARPLTYTVSASGTASPWTIGEEKVDYGDGTTDSLALGYNTDHVYSAEGDYQVTLTVTDAGGRTEKATQKLHVAYQPAGFHPMAPTRVLDTRTNRLGGAPIGPGQKMAVPLLSEFGRDVNKLSFTGEPTAVVLNITAIPQDSDGFLTVYPDGGKRPDTSNLNFAKGQIVPNLVTVPVGPTGDVAIYNRFGNVHVVADLLGYYTAGSGDRFTALNPARLADTRSSGGRLGVGQERTLQVTEKNNVPEGATSAVLNVTSTGADSGGYLTVYPTGTARPGTSNLNFASGQTISNQVVVPLSEDGKVTVYNHTGTTDVVVDLFGYYSPTGESLFTSVTPTRLVDTRTTGTAFGKGSTLAVAAGAPAGATGAVLNVTSTGSSAGGYLTAWADGTSRPGTSNLNFTAGQTVPNHVTTPLGGNGRFDIYNFAGTTDVVADLFGYFSK